MQDALRSFRSSLAAGESRTQAWATVMQELDDRLAEAVDAGLPTSHISALLEEWANIDPRGL